MKNETRLALSWSDYINDYIESTFHPEPTKELLYHYTNIEGLYGILSTNCLWASNINYINDSTEYSYGIGLLNDVLNRTINNIQDDTLKKYLSHIDGVMYFKKQSTYCISFCENKDLLSQWRGYTAGNTGVSIGFSNQEFAFSRNEKLIYKIKPSRVIYGKQKGTEVLEKLIMKMDSFLVNEYLDIEKNFEIIQQQQQTVVTL